MNKSWFWFLFNFYGWLIVIMSIVTAVIVQTWWVVLLGIIGYQFVIFFELTLGRNLGKTGRMRLARAEQENRELRAEQARLLGGIEERDRKITEYQNQAAQYATPSTE
jgi:hypothetical protein